MAFSLPKHKSLQIMGLMRLANNLDDVANRPNKPRMHDFPAEPMSRKKWLMDAWSHMR